MSILEGISLTFSLLTLLSILISPVLSSTTAEIALKFTYSPCNLAELVSLLSKPCAIE